MESSIVQRRREEFTFKANLRSTRYGWLRLTPAYSVHLVRELVSHEEPATTEVLDPFCGTGTTALVCAEQGIAVTTTDINPFLVWLAGTKCANYSAAALAKVQATAQSVRIAILNAGKTREWVPPIHQIEKWWDEETLHALGRAMAVIRALREREPVEVIDLLQVAFCRVMIGAANVSFGHQSMSFRSPRNEEGLFGRDACGQLAFEWDRSIRELIASASIPLRGHPSVLLCDARNLTEQLPLEKYNVVVTSPPYPNRMSYIRELRPYMYWLGHLRDGKEAGELDWKAIGGTWGVATSRLKDWDGVDGLAEYPEIAETCRKIARTSDLLGRYVARYFVDMIKHCSELYRVVKRGGKIHYIVGNSKFYDVLLPVEEYFAGLFRSAKFEEVEIHQIRKRTSKRELFEYRVSAVKN